MTLPDVTDAPVAEEVSEPEAVAGTIWVCSICGYEHRGEEPPEVCPRCKQPKSAFHKK